MKTNLILFFLVVLCPFMGKAQAPGYLGKKNSISVNFNNFLSFRGPTSQNKGNLDLTIPERKASWGFNYQVDAEISHALNRYNSLSLRFGNYRTGMVAPYQNFLFSDLFHLVTANTIGLEWHRFNAAKGALAPLGNKVYYGLKRTALTSETIDPHSRETIEDLEFEFERDLNLFFITYGMANTQIFWDKMMLTLGWEVNIPVNFTYLSAVISGDAYSGFFGGSLNEDFYKSGLVSRIVSHEIIRFRVGVGYLLF